MIRLLLLVLFLFCCMIPSQAGTGGAQGSSEAPLRKTLPNGLRILCVQEKETPLVAIDVFIKTGTVQETGETAGLSSFVARTLLSSTENVSPETLQYDINALGGNVIVTRQPDWLLLSALTVKDKFDDAAYLVKEVTQYADFDPDAIETARHEILEDIDSDNAGILTTAYAGLRRSLYPNGDDALPELGTARSIKRITRASLLHYFRHTFVPKNLVVVVVGNIDAAEAAGKLEKDYEDFPIAGRVFSRFTLPEAPDISPLTHTPEPVRVQMPGITEVCVVAGYRAPSPESGDSPAILVLNALLGGMKSSRLFTNLREKQSLAYELGSFYTPRLRSSDLAAYVFTKPDRHNSADGKTTFLPLVPQQELFRQLESFKTVPPTAAELTRAKHFVIGSYKIKHERLEDRAGLLGTAELSAKDGMVFDTNFADYINAVTADDIQRVARRYLVHPAVSTVEPTPDTNPDDGQ